MIYRGVREWRDKQKEPSMEKLPECLSLPESELVSEVRRTFGEIPAISLEAVLVRGSEAKRFQAVDESTSQAICDIADRRGIPLPTRTTRQTAA